MKKFLYMEGFKAWPETAVSSAASLIAYLAKTVPYIDGQIALALASGSTAGIANESFVLDGAKYSGIYLPSGIGQLNFTIPKMTQGEKKRVYYGGRMVGNSFQNSAPFWALVNATSPGIGRFESTAAASNYLELVVDMSTNRVYIYVNKLKKFEYTLTSTDLSRISAGTARLFFGIYAVNNSAFNGKPGVYTDLYIATETWTEDTAPPVEVFGPVTIDSYKVTHADAPGFSTDATSAEAALETPYKDSYAAKDQPLYTNNDDGVGTFTFAQVPAEAKLFGAMMTVQAVRGASSGASMVTKINDGTTDVITDEYVPPLATATTTPSVVYDITPSAGATPDYLNKINVKINSKEV